MQLSDVRGELVALWQAWLERVLAALLASNASSTDTQDATLLRLQLLQQFLPQAAVPTLPLAEDAPRLVVGGVPLLCELLRCQAHLHQHAAGAATSAVAVVVQQLQQGLLKVAQACRHSDWTLAGCVATGLARQCRELTLLAGFTGSAMLVQQLATIEAQLLLWHAGPQPPSMQQQALVQKQLLALTRGRTDLCRALQLHTSPPEESVLLQPETGQAEEVVHAECAQLTGLLRPALEAAALTTEAMMFACYRLAWVLHALGRRTLTEVGLLVYQVLVRHWQQRAPLQRPEQELLAAWLVQVQQAGEQSALHDTGHLLSLLGAALASWPGQAGSADQAGQGSPDLRTQEECSVLLPLPAAQHTAALSIRHLPEYLAASLSALLQVDAAWFADRRSWQRCADLLHDELHLLEQGAAALRLSPLEQFCSLLLGVHVQLDATLPQGPWPGKVLWRAHHELVVMLDRAALWLEPLPNADTLALLRDCLQQGEERCMLLLRAPREAEPLQALACALALFGQQAGRLLSRPVRIRLSAAVAMRAEFDVALLRTLQETLRWLLLQHESSVELRRRQRQALATTLAVTLQSPDDASCQVQVLETGMRSLPGDKALHGLQRSLGLAVEALSCEEVPGLGRRVQYRLTLASLQRALDKRYRSERRARQN